MSNKKILIIGKGEYTDFQQKFGVENVINLKNDEISAGKKKVNDIENFITDISSYFEVFDYIFIDVKDNDSQILISNILSDTGKKEKFYTMLNTALKQDGLIVMHRCLYDSLVNYKLNFFEKKVQKYVKTEKGVFVIAYYKEGKNSNIKDSASIDKKNKKYTDQKDSNFEKLTEIDFFSIFGLTSQQGGGLSVLILKINYGM